LRESCLSAHCRARLWEITPPRGRGEAWRGCAGKPKVIPADDFVRDELYLGYSQAFGTQPFVAGPVRPFSKADNASYWLRDSLHFSKGMAPASIALLDDAQTWGAQLGAELVGVPPTQGIDQPTGGRTWRSARCRPRPGQPAAHGPAADFLIPNGQGFTPRPRLKRGGLT
jgi:hypothetical protein